MDRFDLKKKPLDGCCQFFSLKTGSLIAGIGCIILSVLTIIYVILTDQRMRMIFLEDLDPFIVKIIIVFNLCMTIFLSGVMVLGVIKERKFYMVPWVVLGLVLIVCLLISVIYSACEYIFKEKPFEGVTILIIGFIITCVYFYMWLVVYSFYLKLKEEDHRIPYYKPAHSRLPTRT